MSVTITLLGKFLMTVLAGIWSFGRVNAQMVKDVAQFAKLFVTFEALQHLVKPIGFRVVGNSITPAVAFLFFDLFALLSTPLFRSVVSLRLNQFLLLVYRQVRGNLNRFDMKIPLSKD